MLQTSARLLKLLSLLQARRFWSGEALAEALGVTERSVRRDVDKLRALGYPVHATAGVGGGYRLGAGRDLPPLPLDDDEAVAVAVGLRAAATGAVTGLEEASVRALVKLEQVLPKRLRSRVQALQAVSIRLREGAPTVNAEILAAIASACRDEQLARFPYEARGGARTERRVEPYRLVHTSNRWYLLAFDLDRHDWRTFRVDRVGEVTPGVRFAPRPLPSDDVAAYVTQAVSTEAYRYRARILVHAPADEVAARLSALDGRIEPVDAARCRVHAGANHLDALAFHFGWLGFPFEVEAPPELVEHVRRLGERLVRAGGGAGVG